MTKTNRNNNVFPEFHQVAIHVPFDHHDTAVAMLSKLGNGEWSHDAATLVGEAWDATAGMYKESRIQGLMSFNYTMLGGRELEVLSYEGESHHSLAGTDLSNPNGFISHMSTHVDDADVAGAEWAAKFEDQGVRVVHRFETFNHVNPAIREKKRFKEVVLGTRHVLGYDLKFIERLTEGPWTI